MFVKELIANLKDFDENLEVRVLGNFSYKIMDVNEDSLSKMGDVGKPNYEQKVIHIKT